MGNVFERRRSVGAHRQHWRRVWLGTSAIKWTSSCRWTITGYLFLMSPYQSLNVCISFFSLSLWWTTLSQHSKGFAIWVIDKDFKFCCRLLYILQSKKFCAWPGLQNFHSEIESECENYKRGRARRFVGEIHSLCTPKWMKYNLFRQPLGGGYNLFYRLCHLVVLYPSSTARFTIKVVIHILPYYSIQILLDLHAIIVMLYSLPCHNYVLRCFADLLFNPLVCNLCFSIIFSYKAVTAIDQCKPFNGDIIWTNFGSNRRQL